MFVLVKGVFGGLLNWLLVGVGVLIGVIVVVFDEILVKMIINFWLLLLVVGMGMYLLVVLMLMILIGVFFGWIYDFWVWWFGDDDECKKWLGVMFVMGLIVGESLYGVFFVVIVVIIGKEELLVMVGDGFRFVF